MIKTVVIIIVLASIFYLLYINGCMVVNSKRAVSFVASRECRKASFTSCSGHIKRIVRFKESKTYNFILHSELTKGDMTVALLDSDKQELICLNSNEYNAEVFLEKGKRYYLVFSFEAATGSYTLDWN